MSFPATSARSIASARSSRNASTRAASSKWENSTAARSSPVRARRRLAVAVMASDPMFLRRRLDLRRLPEGHALLDMAETFHLPVVYFCDCPGFLIAWRPRRAASSARVCAHVAMFQTTVPWCTFIIRNAFGVAGAAHQNGARLNWRYAWPVRPLGLAALEGGIEAAYRADIEDAADPKAKMSEIATG